ncbi:MAG: hypothetical protein R2754_02650 [Microthrixaceae bacterium]
MGPAGTGREVVASGDDPSPARATIQERRVGRLLVGLGVVLMWLVVTRGVPWHLFAPGEFSADFYDEQARALLAGHLDVNPAVPAIEGFDVNGRTQLYFGLFLAIVRMPLVALTDAAVGRLTGLSIVVAYAVALEATFRLAVAARAPLRPGAAPRPGDCWRIAALMAAVATSPALFAGGWLTVYHETEIWALALGIAALAAAVRLLSDPAPRHALVASAAAAACVLTRVTVGLGVTLAVALLVVATLRHRRAALIGAAATLAGGVGAFVAVNMARFGTLFSIPVDRQQMTLLTPERAQWFAEHNNSFFSPQFVPSNLWSYLRPDAVAFERLAPVIRFGPHPVELGGVDFESITPTTSLTVSGTLLAALAVVGLVVAVRTRRWLWVAVASVLSVGGLASLAIGFVANRYLIDLLLPLVVLAALAVFVAGRPAWLTPRRVVGLVGALALWGMWVNVALGMWAGQARNPGFTEGRYRLDGMVFPSPSPGLERLDAAQLVDPPRFGLVGLDPADGDAAGCDGVYLSTVDEWSALELGPGREVVGTVTVPSTDDPPALLAARDDWSLTLDGRGVVAFGPAGAPTRLARVEVDPGDRVDLRVVADSVTTVRSVQLNGELTFLPEVVLEGSSPMVSDAEPAGTTELCTLIAERLGDP